MNLTNDELRLIVAGLYDSPGWDYRVRKVMKINQVAAIYADFSKKRQFLLDFYKDDKETFYKVAAMKGKDITKEYRKVLFKDKNKDEGHWEQMTLSDFMEEINGR